MSSDGLPKWLLVHLFFFFTSVLIHVLGICDHVHLIIIIFCHTVMHEFALSHGSTSVLDNFHTFVVKTFNFLLPL